MSRDLTPPNPTTPKKGVPHEAYVALGEWYWHSKKGERRLMCVMRVGSNYAKLQDVYGQTTRVHFDEFDDVCEKAHDAETVIKEAIQGYQAETMRLLAEVEKVTARLALDPKAALGTPEEPTYALSRMHAATSVDDYKAELATAHQKSLPALFEQIRSSNQSLSIWMAAGALPFEAKASGLTGVLDVVKERVFDLELYAGLVEKVTEIASGAPAPASERLHLYQRRLYMDEECLVGYKIGGIDCTSIQQFEDWLLEPSNRTRIFGHPRAMVAFKVRRAEKERTADDLQTFLVNLRLKQGDERTYLYIQNGEQVFRLSTAFDFGPRLFPGTRELEPGRKLWAHTFAGRVDTDSIISDAQYQEMCAAYDREQAAYQEWKKQQGSKKAHYWGRVPYTNPYTEYVPCNPDSVFYDDIMVKLNAEVKAYQRVALILQGLFDRSPVLHPHPPVHVWDPDSLGAAVELVYDSDRALYGGAPPDFEAYRARLAKSLQKGSVTIGQDAVWWGEESERQRAQWDRSYQSGTFRAWRPWHNPGPGLLAEVAEWKPRARKAVFRWERQPVREWEHPEGTTYPCSLTVDADQLFNASAYTPGDYLQFYQDPRTRRAYFKWAHRLLLAEEYHAGNLKVGLPPGADNLFG